MSIQEQIEAHNKALAKFSNDLLKEYRPALLAVEKELLQEVTTMLTTLQFDASGNLLPDQDLPLIVAKIDFIYLKIANNPAFKESTLQYLSNFDQIRQNQIALHESINKIETTAQLISKLSAQQQFLINATDYSLRQGGLKLCFVEQAKQIVTEAATFGYSIQESEKLLRQRIISTKAGDSYFMRYATQVARDSISEYTGQINQMVAEEYNMEFIRYVGSLVDDSRPICKHIIKNLKGKIKVSDLPALLKTYGKSKSLSRGMKDNTDAKNFCIVRGGYNCRHEAIPVRE